MGHSIRNVSCPEAGRPSHGSRADSTMAWGRVEVRFALCLVETSLKWSLQLSNRGGKRGEEGRQRLLLHKDPGK